MRARIDPNHHKGIIVTDDSTGEPLDVTGSDLTNSNPMHVAIVDGTGDQVLSFGGTQYSEDETAPFPATGTLQMWRDTGDAMRPTGTDFPLPVAITQAVNVTATDFDIRNLAFSDDAVNVSGSVVQTEGSIYKKMADDSTTVGVTYIGEAVLGSLESDPVWRIKKVDETTAIVQITWTGTGFTAVWDDRVTETYS